MMKIELVITNICFLSAFINHTQTALTAQLLN